MSIEVANETNAELPLEEFSALARYVLTEMNVHPQAEVFIRIVDEPTIAELHERWLDLPGPTDVMSFPIDELRPGRSPEDPSENGVLGDIVLCPTVAARQAVEAGHSQMEEMLLLTCHGLLHLLGFDHAEKADEEVMFALQRKLLLTFLAGR